MKKVEVLVIDDSLNAADEYARLIQLKTNLSVIAIDNYKKAINIIKSHPIKVAVLDQKMPDISGTDLFKEFIKIDPLIKAIMLTGEANAQDVGDAMRIGFSDYLHKSDIQELPQLILLNYAKYEVDIAKKASSFSKETLYTYTKGLILGNTISINLLSTEIIEHEHILSDSWFTSKQLNAGENVREADKIEITKRFIHDIEGEEKLISKMGFTSSAVQQFMANLENSITLRFKDQIFSENKHSIEIFREYKLPDEPINPKEIHVVARHYQRAPVYRAIRCLLERECECCKNKESFILLIYQLTSRIATRQIDYLSDSSSQTIPTGVENY